MMEGNWTYQGLLLLITNKGPMGTYGCRYCDRFIPIVRRDGKPFEYTEHGYLKQHAPGNNDVVYDIYNGHAEGCIWMHARQMLGDPRAS